MMNLAREPVRRKPFGHRVRVEKCPIDLLGRRTQNAVKPDGVGRHYMLLSLGRSSRSQRRSRRHGLPPPNDLAAQRLPHWLVTRLDLRPSVLQRPRAAAAAGWTAASRRLHLKRPDIINP